MDSGLLGGLAEGIKSGMSSYNDARERARADRLQKAQMLNMGLMETPEGEFEKTPEQLRKESLQNLTTQAGIIKGGKEAVLNPSTNSYELRDIPGYRDLERENLKADIDFKRAKTDSEKAPKEEKAPTPDQRKVAGFADRVEEAESVFNDLAKKGYNRAGKMSSLEANVSNIPLVGGALSSWQGEDTKSQKQAEENFINASLRRESGSAISPSEFENAERQYFPRSGDTPKILQQKANNRKSIIAGFKAEAGRSLGLLRAEKQGLAPSITPKGLLPASGSSKPAKVIQNGVEYNLNPQTGEYE